MDNPDDKEAKKLIEMKRIMLEQKLRKHQEAKK